MFVITGVTGNTGSATAQALLDAGKDVRVIVRSEEKGLVWKDKGAEVVVADLFDGAAVTKALEGAEATYLMLPPDYASTDFLGSRMELAEILVKAAEDANVPHVVFLSSVGAQHSHDDKTGPIRTLAYFERLFEKSPIKTTAIRPGYFLENWGAVLQPVLNDGVLPSFLQPLDMKIDMIATQDIGKKIADSLLNPGDDAHRVQELKGAAQYSPRDVAQAFSKALNKDITPIEVPEEGWAPGLVQAGFPQSTADLFVEMYQNINSGFIDFTQENAAKGQTELDDFIKRFVA
ncbi:NmrA family NAD(P)-binding protein [Terasakiella sp. A23]|uniref:NmrA family NAD(P)-binding protein n=1 Tax=Terasakiella sp. FCG-A23 TaxID=3080561 RepID=UPI002954FB9E|nr:NmrA family NAD(P)-binding protein [Terasakiella sp. A23]MDV7340699.1 NmrA family NAD(P)-binding protein [Terasakiella sp. A23]